MFLKCFAECLQTAICIFCKQQVSLLLLNYLGFAIRNKQHSHKLVSQSPCCPPTRRSAFTVQWVLFRRCVQVAIVLYSLRLLSRRLFLESDDESFLLYSNSQNCLTRTSVNLNLPLDGLVQTTGCSEMVNLVRENCLIASQNWRHTRTNFFLLLHTMALAAHYASKTIIPENSIELRSLTARNR